MVKTLFASVIAVAATIFLSIGAAAAVGGTAQHFSLTMPQQCFPGKDRGAFCVASTGEETVVPASSGNFIGEVNVRDSFVVSENSGAIVASGTDSYHEHVLYANNFAVLKEGGIHSTSTVTSGGTTCTYSFDIHVTGLDFATGTGHIQYSNFRVVCI